MLTIRQILVPVDFTEVSDRAVSDAIDLAAKFGAAVTVMHAYQTPVYALSDGAMISAVDFALRVAAAAREQLEAIVQRHADRGVTLTGVLRDGAAWEEIVAVASQAPAELIVIGTHGRRGLARALLGSVAEKVIRTTTIPVFLVHEEAAAEAGTQPSAPSAGASASA